ncbi:MAG: alpha/beta hydrolase [Rhizobiales bacterium]|nr:alpha/beta hydrolase [Hyphomicrobiales bacterium]
MTAQQDKQRTVHTADDPGYVSQFVSAQDGLRLHMRCYASRSACGRPVVCLPGLSRNSADFHALAAALASDPAHPRRVLALDYRGRGRSEYDRNPKNYSLPVELSDVIAVITALDMAPVVFVGTSRGSILAMLLAAIRPGAIAGCVLNDIGPVIEPQGLMRIKSYVGKLPEPRNFEEAADLLRRLFVMQFPKMSQQDWLANAKRSWREQDGRLIPDYDVALANDLAKIELEQPLPALWKEFDALKHVPVMVVRGENSDILSPATVAAMAARRSDLEILNVPDQGHAPFLDDNDTIGRVAGFVARCEDERSTTIRHPEVRAHRASLEG